MSDNEALKIIGECEIAKLSLGAGDILVIKFTQRMTAETVARAQKYFRDMLPHGVRAAIFDDGVELSVLTRAEIEAKVV